MPLLDWIDISDNTRYMSPFWRSALFGRFASSLLLLRCIDGLSQPLYTGVALSLHEEVTSHALYCQPRMFKDKKNALTMSTFPNKWAPASRVVLFFFIWDNSFRVGLNSSLATSISIFNTDEVVMEDDSWYSSLSPLFGHPRVARLGRRRKSTMGFSLLD